MAVIFREVPITKEVEHNIYKDARQILNRQNMGSEQVNKTRRNKEEKIRAATWKTKREAEKKKEGNKRKCSQKHGKRCDCQTFNAVVAVNAFVYQSGS